MLPLIEDPGREWKKAAFSQYPRFGGIEGYAIVRPIIDSRRFHWNSFNYPIVFWHLFQEDAIMVSMEHHAFWIYWSYCWTSNTALFGRNVYSF